jgi:hypothetical protein
MNLLSNSGVQCSEVQSSAVQCSGITVLFAAPPDCEAGKFSCGAYKWNSTYCIPPNYRCCFSYCSSCS